MFTDWETVKSTAIGFRNYDLEWAFIKWMDNLADINCKHSCICDGMENLDLVGVQFFMTFNPTNDNSISLI